MFDLASFNYLAQFELLGILLSVLISTGSIASIIASVGYKVDFVT